MEYVRAMTLLKKAVNHIENFEDDESESVLESLGFTKKELVEIRNNNNYPQNIIDLIDDDDIGNMDMVSGYISHDEDIIWILNDKGYEYMYSDSKEDENGSQGQVTECVPFKDFAYYIYKHENGYFAYTWQDEYENYLDECETLKECLECFFGEEEE